MNGSFFWLFKNTVTSFESDANLDYQPLERDKLATVVFHSAGWNMSYSSQNYGWTVERDEIMGYYNLTKLLSRRPDFVQLGPSFLSGNTSNDPSKGIL